MHDSIEQQIARLDLPDASTRLDRRIDDLFRSRPNGQQPESQRGITATALACGSVAVALIGLMLPGSPSKPEAAGKATPMVVNIDVSIPLLNKSDDIVTSNEPFLLAPESLVVTTETNEGDEQ